MPIYRKEYRIIYGMSMDLTGQQKTIDNKKPLISQGLLYCSGPCWTFKWWRWRESNRLDYVDIYCLSLPAKGASTNSCTSKPGQLGGLELLLDHLFDLHDFKDQQPIVADERFFFF